MTESVELIMNILRIIHLIKKAIVTCMLCILIHTNYIKTLLNFTTFCFSFVFGFQILIFNLLFLNTITVQKKFKKYNVVYIIIRLMGVEKELTAVVAVNQHTNKKLKKYFFLNNCFQLTYTTVKMILIRPKRVK